MRTYHKGDLATVKNILSAYRTVRKSMTEVNYAEMLIRKRPKGKGYIPKKERDYYDESRNLLLDADNRLFDVQQALRNQARIELQRVILNRQWKASMQCSKG